jgi:porin
MRIVQATEPATETQSAPQGLWQQTHLLGDMGGLRPSLEERGVTLSWTEISESLINAGGGIQSGGAVHGLGSLSLSLDTQAAWGHAGGSAFLSALNIHGRNFSAFKTGSVQTSSNIEATNAMRLWELWYQQTWNLGATDLRLGQQSIDQEFMSSQYTALFLAPAFGWPAAPSLDLPGGGPVYPLSSLGLRLRHKLSTSLTLMVGVYDGNPAGTTQGDPQAANANGTTFNLSSGALTFAEAQWTRNADDANPTPANTRLPGTYKLGFWHHSQHFDDLHLGTDGLSLANPASNGKPQQHAGNYGLYAVADQVLWRTEENSPRSLAGFARLVVAPDDRNPIRLSANFGLTLTGPFAGRDKDIVGIGLAYIEISSNLRRLDQDSAARVRSSETLLEVSYQYQVAPWWQLQTSLQHIGNPGAGQKAAVPTQGIENATVFLLRSTVTF